MCTYAYGGVSCHKQCSGVMAMVGIVHTMGKKSPSEDSDGGNKDVSWHHDRPWSGAGLAVVRKR